MRSASADISVKIVVPKPARREAITAADYDVVTYTGLRERLRRREPLAVAFLDLGSPVSAEVTAMSGFDVVVVDLEHGAGDEGAARAQIRPPSAPRRGRRARARRARSQVGRMLDAGADGVIVPQVGSPEEAERVARRRALRRHRAGSRRSRAATATAPPGRTSARAPTSGVACIVQIERASALEAVDAIAALDDVDALLMGPADLSADLGCELDLDGPRLREAARAHRRRGRAPRQDGGAAHGARRAGAGVPRARLHDALVHVRERAPRRRIVGRRGEIEGTLTGV